MQAIDVKTLWVKKPRPRSDEMSKPWQPLKVLIAAEQAVSISGDVWR
ncbi:MAG TPA: hypothetical protein VM910_27265 [Bradyrhizobium sp.]|nr:hypothetical protein [Bradyrhizobium sp.]